MVASLRKNGRGKVDLRDDSIMADRGFDILEDLVPRGVRLNIPPFLREVEWCMERIKKSAVIVFYDLSIWNQNRTQCWFSAIKLNHSCFDALGSGNLKLGGCGSNTEGSRVSWDDHVFGDMSSCLRMHRLSTDSLGWFHVWSLSVHVWKSGTLLSLENSCNAWHITAKFSQLALGPFLAVHTYVVPQISNVFLSSFMLML